MSINVYAKPSGTQGALQLNGVDAVVYDSTGIVSGVNKSAVSQQATLGTAQATTSGTALDSGTTIFPAGIPSWVKRITLMFNGVSTNGTSIPIIQIGSGAIENTGYSGDALLTSSTNGTAGTITNAFPLSAVSAASYVYRGHMVLTHTGSNNWISSGVITTGGGQIAIVAGTKTTSGALDRIRLTTVNGTDTFDAGSWNILYE